MRNATLKDVAARAGVSTATVSRVLHNHGYVSAAARERVEAALRESDYRLNTVAQELRRRRTIALGLIVQGLENPVFAEVTMGVERAAAEQGFNVLLFNARGSAELERRHVETLLRRRVDGIVFTAVLRAEHVRIARAAGVSVVQVARRVDEEAAAVVIDGHAGAVQAMEHLLGLGHRAIAYLGDPYGFFGDPSPFPEGGGAVRERFAAYREGLAGVGVAPKPSWLVEGEFPRDPGGWGSVETGAGHMRRLLAQAPELTAVFAASDILAAGALQELYRQGVRVPADLSLVGVDDSFARHLSPPLTSVRYPMFDLGMQAASIAIEQLDGDGGEPAHVVLPMELAVRESTALPRSG
jgi:DNA-binding LacI/PurR family transcriptional regulator